jgi:hypothetical protein
MRLLLPFLVSTLTMAGESERNVFASGDSIIIGDACFGELYVMCFSAVYAEEIRAQVLTQTSGERSQNTVQLTAVTPQEASSQALANGPSSSTVPKACLNIHLYNLAAVSSQPLELAIQDAEGVLATAGVDKVCWHVLADAPEAHTLHTSPPATWRKNRLAESRGYIVTVIVPGVPVDYLPGALGFALPDAEIGVNAMVFCDRIERFRESSKIDLPTLLGHAMAHEIGHVLLGTTEHSTDGIMKARWSHADFQVAGLKVLKFTARQREEI